MMKKHVLLAMILVLAIATSAAADFGKCSGEGHRESRIFKKFDKMDINGDGSITHEEADALSTIRFMKKDANSDGFLTEGEFVRHGKHFRKWGRHINEERREEKLNKVQDWMAKRFSEVDKDGDKQVSRKEFKVMGEGRFTLADTDRDGRLSWAEFKAHARTMKERMLNK
jgi:Ca2+-binding EF-hand superfamily protein